MHGLSETLTSDNERKCISNRMELFLKINGITHNKTTPLWPQTHKHVEKAIESIVIEEQNWKHEWDTFLLSNRNIPDCTTFKMPSLLLVFLYC